MNEPLLRASEPTQDALRDVARGVLADCAFLLTEPAEPPLAWPDHVIHASIDFSGPWRGKLSITAPEALALAMASDMLGVEACDPSARELSHAALSELSNVIAGALTARLFGTKVTCSLGIPRVAAGLPGAAPPGGMVRVSLTDLEGQPLEVELQRAEGASA